MNEGIATKIIDTTRQLGMTMYKAVTIIAPTVKAV